MHAQPTFDAPTSGVSEDLGLNLAEFRELQLLQLREIEPEDYDLLMRLSAKATTKCLGEAQLGRVTHSFRAARDATDACAVCLGAMGAGEELCQLACRGGHVFHQHCIHEWLRTASRCCPVDQQDLSTL